MINAERLLDKVAALKRASDEKARETGRNFNIFSILGVEGRETSTHSAFLAEMLDKNGSHGQGVKFLELFIKTLNEDGLTCIPNLDVKSAKVKIEKSVGKVNHETGEGGRIDIYISDRSGNAICIENKIYAKDQRQQLLRYSNYLKDNHYRESILLYLTLYGSKASEASIQNEHGNLIQGRDYYCISYQKHVLRWLVECHKAAIYVPVVREAIDQYIHLIKILTKQSMEEKEKQKMVALVRKHHEEFLTLNEARNAFFEDVDKKIKELQKKLNLNDFTRSGKGEIWDKEDQKSKLQYTLVVGLKQIGNANKLQLKVRLTPRGWQIELWNIENLVGDQFYEQLTADYCSVGNSEKFVKLTKRVLASVKAEDEHKDSHFVPYNTQVAELKIAIENMVAEMYKNYSSARGY